MISVWKMTAVVNITIKCLEKSSISLIQSRRHWGFPGVWHNYRAKIYQTMIRFSIRVTFILKFLSKTVCLPKSCIYSSPPTEIRTSSKLEREHNLVILVFFPKIHTKLLCNMASINFDMKKLL